MWAGRFTIKPLRHFLGTVAALHKHNMCCEAAYSSDYKRRKSGVLNPEYQLFSGDGNSLMIQFKQHEKHVVNIFVQFRTDLLNFKYITFWIWLFEPFLWNLSNFVCLWAFFYDSCSIQRPWTWIVCLRRDCIYHCLLNRPFREGYTHPFKLGLDLEGLAWPLCKDNSLGRCVCGKED